MAKKLSQAEWAKVQEATRRYMAEMREAGAPISAVGFETTGNGTEARLSASPEVVAQAAEQEAARLEKMAGDIQEADIRRVYLAKAREVRAAVNGE